ncbi:hypothetical protein [Streptomyces sp. AC602_WCS936]|uniref:hypothetical protein n=1 Tax=Streptomyces sp. AC602_WCS936 TaxID=2823685 RepID=UPI001C269D8F|nr:hypothetical protein [Streptomyces sp. AC602_WCS936]
MDSRVRSRGARGRRTAGCSRRCATEAGPAAHYFTGSSAQAVHRADATVVEAV